MQNCKYYLECNLFAIFIVFYYKNFFIKMSLHINDLPEYLLRYILSFLEDKQLRSADLKQDLRKKNRFK